MNNDNINSEILRSPAAAQDDNQGVQNNITGSVFKPGNNNPDKTINPGNEITRAI